MMRFRGLIVLVAATCVLGGCAANAQRKQMQNDEERIYRQFAGSSIDQIRSFRYTSWQPVGDYSLLLETRLNEWYLIDVGGPCMGLPFAHAIAFRNQMNSLQARFDYIIVDGDQCRIETIRPVDYKAAQQAIKALDAAD